MQVDLNCGKILGLVPALSANIRDQGLRDRHTCLVYYEIIESIKSFIVNFREFQFSTHLGWFQPCPQILDFGVNR